MTTPAVVRVIHEGNALVKGTKERAAVDVQPQRVVLSLSTVLRNGAWSDYPRSYSAWKDRTPDVYESAKTLTEGQVIWVWWEEKK